MKKKKNAHPKAEQAQVKNKIGKRKVDNGEAEVRATPFEDEFQLASMVRIELRGKRIGAYLLKKGENGYMLQFGFECQGIHTTLISEQIEPIFDAIEASLKDLPDKERLTIHLGSFTSDAARQAELKDLCQQAPNSELRYLLVSDRKRVQELTDMGVRKPKFLRLYSTYTVELSTLDPKLQLERFEDYKEFLVSALMAMVVGTKRGDGNADRALSDTVRSILALALEEFFGDWQIRDRYAKAFINGFGSPEWAAMPTLADFLNYCSSERLRIDAIAGDIQTALPLIKLRLRFWMSSRVGKAISSPSTFRSDALLLVFALRNLSNDEDAAILSLSAYSAALRRALAAPASIFFIDESPILFEYDSIASLVGRLCANGAKAGIRVILSAQDPDTIAKSPSGSKIFQNLTTRLIGRIQPTAVDSFVQILKYPPEIINRNSTESFFPKKTGMYSQWLLDDNGIFTYCRYYPSPQLLGVVANNPDEQAARTKILATHDDKLIALTEYAKQLVAGVRPA